MIYGVFGHHTGGTSAVAGVVRLHGLQMWGQPRTLDDYELLAVLQQKKEADLFRERGTDWAFKHPLILDDAAHLIERYNVKPIYVFRDPAAIWKNSGKTPTKEKIQKSCQFFSQMAELPDGLYVSYEKLITDKLASCTEIAEYLGKPFNPECLEWIAPEKKYHPIGDHL